MACIPGQRYTELRSKTVKELKVILRTQNRSISGKKEELISRIMGNRAAWYKGLLADTLRRFVEDRRIKVTTPVTRLSKDDLIDILINTDANWRFDFLGLPPGQVSQSLLFLVCC